MYTWQSRFADFYIRQSPAKLKSLFCKVRVTDGTRCHCSDSRHVMAPSKLLYYLLFKNMLLWGG